MENRIIVIYKSKTGFTEKYAQWISEELSCDMICYKKRKEISFDKYDTIIFGGGIYAGMISGIKWFKEKFSELAGKKIVVFSTGATPAGVPTVEETLKKNFTEEEWEKIKVFYMQGGLCYEKMNILERMMMAVFRKILKRTEGESEAYKMLQHSYDSTRKEFIQPLVEYCVKKN